MRRIALVDLLHARAGDPPVSLGIASIAASLKRARVPHRIFAHNVAMPQSHDTLASLADAVADWRPQVAGIGAYVWNDLYLNPLARQLRARNVKVLLGGPQISYHDPMVEEQTLEILYPHADFFIRGRGEQAVADLAQGVHARGLHVAGTTDNGAHAAAPLQTLPSPFLEGVIGPNAMQRAETQRGCGFSCSFCQHRSATGGVERAAQTRVFDDLRWLVESGTARINLVDPTFNWTSAHAVTTLDALSAFCSTSGTSPVLTLQTRPEKINRSFRKSAGRILIVS